MRVTSAQIDLGEKRRKMITEHPLYGKTFKNNWDMDLTAESDGVMICAHRDNPYLFHYTIKDDDLRADTYRDTRRIKVVRLLMDAPLNNMSLWARNKCFEVACTLLDELKPIKMPYTPEKYKYVAEFDLIDKDVLKLTCIWHVDQNEVMDFYADFRYDHEYVVDISEN